jgi:hypothetical protein
MFEAARRHLLISKDGFHQLQSRFAWISLVSSSQEIN